MDLSLLLLHGVVAVAALLQAVTGIGFAMIAGPVILLVLGDGSAVQVTTLLSLLIALILAPELVRHADRPTLIRFAIGALIGLPLGLGFYALASIDHLKLVAGLAIGALTVLLLRGGGATTEGAPRPIGAVDWPVGVVSGFFGGCLAMPGPTAALRMTARNMGKTATRATIIALFVLIYPLIFIGQAAVAGGAWTAAETAAVFAPSTIVGVLVGRALAARVSELLFRRLVMVFLILTAAALLSAAVSAMLG